MDLGKSQMDAAANVLGYKGKGDIQFIKQEEHIIGIWIKNFPQNTTEQEFLSAYCAYENNQDAMNSILHGAYRLTSASDIGFNILFDLPVKDSAQKKWWQAWKQFSFVRKAILRQ
jgi:hypothetical protein